MEIPGADVTVLDNLRRRGSELNIQKFNDLGIRFVHGDIRNQGDLNSLDGDFDLLIEASSESSVHAGSDGSPDYVIETNLGGTIHCLNFARRRVRDMIFLSTSRVYSIGPLRQINLGEGPTRFTIEEEQTLTGVSQEGISEDFTTSLPRSLYGATKLASELLLQEFVEMYGLRAVVYRCGVIAGPGQFGRVDQGVFTLWVAHHYFKQPLRYTGFGGTGKQVRDLLHPSDLFALIRKQLTRMGEDAGKIFNVGGRRGISTSLCEWTALCQTIVGNHIPVSSQAETAAVDIPLYISDCRRVSAELGWQPAKSVETIVAEIFDWIHQNEGSLKPIFT